MKIVLYRTWIPAAFQESTRKTKAQLLGYLAFCLLLTGCGRNHSYEDLDKYISDTAKSVPRKIAPLPTFKPVPTFTYEASALRSPFQPTAVSSQKDSLEIHRPKEILESFPLEALRVVGIIKGQDRFWALVATTDGTVYRVTVGNHLGQNFGEVTAINDKKIDIEETVLDNKNAWIKRQNFLTIAPDKK